MKFLDEAGALQADGPTHLERPEFDRLQFLIHKGFELLENAAREIPDLDKLNTTRSIKK